jgi:cysteine desulfurase/selenocysteine lyase
MNLSFMKYNTNYRNLIVGLDTRIPLLNGKYVPAINFDNAATTPPLISVMQDILAFAPYYSSIHRGVGYKSQVSSALYDNSRKAILNFIGGDLEKDTLIYVKNTTEGINKLSYRLCSSEKKCVVLSSDMEHHSNDLPWRDKYIVDYISIDKCGRLSLTDLNLKLIKYEGLVKLVTITGASNVTGFINDVHKIASIVHNHNAKLLVDGAQLIPHTSFNMKSSNPNENIDFLVFSAHKMYAPFGIGVLVGPREAFQDGSPDYKGGGTVKLVTHDYVSWEDPPEKEEAGTPNIIGVIALLSSIKTLNLIGMKNIENHERKLTEYTLKELKKIPSITIYGSTDCGENRLSIIPFNINDIPHETTAKILSGEAGIAVRNGCFCAQPYIQKLLGVTNEELKTNINNTTLHRPGMVRISYGLYNNYNEIDSLINMLYKIVKNKAYYMNKYNSI